MANWKMQSNHIKIDEKHMRAEVKFLDDQQNECNVSNLALFLR